MAKEKVISPNYSVETIGEATITAPVVVDDVEEEELEEVRTGLHDDEAQLLEEVIKERRLHREALSNLHQVYRREDARRILENMPYRGATLIPVIRMSGGKKTLFWYMETIDSIVGDLKQKFTFYDTNLNKKKAQLTHDLLKKIESQRKKTK